MKIFVGFGTLCDKGVQSNKSNETERRLALSVTVVGSSSMEQNSIVRFIVIACTASRRETMAG